ncbi:hypothetical protein GIY11_02120 [Aerococcaceae bacterium DSM 109653]|uniref:Uncharacterized protein n=1 Tax=Fundicoccus ignavus TaxID=2664442 RepID=A0A844BFT1_9LACT|nr:hypothetical protein [Fundicoccus ignavus]MRI80825.1 hypothetical protein [Fundicoccus ignavus]
MKKVYLFHPLKHHLFYSGRGITKAKRPHISTLYFGFYNNNSFLNFLLSASGKTQHLGYRYPEIDRVVKTFTRTKVLFLLQNFKKSYRDKFIEIFGKYA